MMAITTNSSTKVNAAHSGRRSIGRPSMITRHWSLITIAMVKPPRSGRGLPRSV